MFCKYFSRYIFYCSNYFTGAYWCRIECIILKISFKTRNRPFYLIRIYFNRIEVFIISSYSVRPGCINKHIFIFSINNQTFKRGGRRSWNNSYSITNFSWHTVRRIIYYIHIPCTRPSCYHCCRTATIKIYCIMGT